MHGWLCPICLIHLIGRKSPHFEKKLQFRQYQPILFSLTTKILQSHLLTLKSYWVHEKNLLTPCWWLAQKKWYELSVSDCVVFVNRVGDQHEIDCITSFPLSFVAGEYEQSSGRTLRCGPPVVECDSPWRNVHLQKTAQIRIRLPHQWKIRNMQGVRSSRLPARRAHHCLQCNRPDQQYNTASTES